MRVALVVPRSLDDSAVRDAAMETYRDLVDAGHTVDCFVVADPGALCDLGDLDDLDDGRTRLCVVDHGFRSERWSRRSPLLARAVEHAMVRAAAVRLRAVVAQANERAEYDAFVQPRWSA